ncbi:hatching enzyme 1.2-like isoform X2 [Centroberyx affinis]|uniref:hatching enzyme 1.2-like isoform X2 n=1 Tax=Centroberyx affinis TaxID=166261 RepID=UPI003A5C739B
MTPVLLFLLLSLMSRTVFSAPPNAADEDPDLESMDISEILETANKGLDSREFPDGDIRVNRKRNAVPCTARGCKWPKSRWSRYVYIPVRISWSFSRAERNVIIRSLVSFYRSTCIRFRWRSYQRDYLSFYPGTGCWSYLGRQGGRQLISLQKRGCVYTRTVQHEVLHALGFHHEQVRSDRDQHVSILYQNIQPGRAHNFRKVATNNLGTPYDYNSVMHYGRFAFSKNRQPTIIPKPNANAVIGRASRMSANDIKRVNILYQCRGY